MKNRAGLLFALFGVAAAAFFLAAPLFGVHGAALARTWIARADGPWGLAIVVGAFAALAFVGVPQVALIAAAVAILGPARGGCYSWIATMVSAMIGFGIGRAVGAASVRGLHGERWDRFIDLVGRNGLVASLAVRLVPLAPFPLINLAAGVAPISMFDFAVGTAIGIVPRIAVTALAGGILQRLFGLSMQ